MAIPELEQQLVQLFRKEKLYIIQYIVQNLNTHNNNTHPDQPSNLSEFFYQSPLLFINQNRINETNYVNN